MRATAWRPTANLRKRHAKYLSLLDASGVAALFLFFLALYLVTTMPFQHPVMVDLAAVSHPKPQKGALREDAIIVTVKRDGSVDCGNIRILPEDLPGSIRDAYKKSAERKVYLKADARVKYAEVKAVLDQIPSAGIQDVVFLVEDTRAPNL